MSDEKDDKWEMPTPVFRTTSGALPRSFEETISQSFSPNKEQNEAVDDSDILSLHDTPQMDDKAAEYSPVYDDEAVTETPDTNPEQEAGKDKSQPVVVTAKSQQTKSTSTQNGSRSNMLIYVLIALIAAVAACVYYFSQTRQ